MRTLIRGRASLRVHACVQIESHQVADRELASLATKVLRTELLCPHFHILRARLEPDVKSGTTSTLLPNRRLSPRCSIEIFWSFRFRKKSARKGERRVG